MTKTQEEAYDIKEPLKHYLKNHLDAGKFKHQTPSQALAAGSFNHFLGEQADLNYLTFRGNEFGHPDLSGKAYHKESHLLKLRGVKDIHWFGADFSDTQMMGIHLIGLRAAMVNFSRSLLITGTLERTVLHQCNFKQAALSGLTVTDANLDYSTFRDTNMELSWMTQTSCQDACFDFANLHKTQWYWMQFQRTRFVGADLCGAIMYNTNLSHADMRFANCLGANFQNVVIEDVKWDGAVMIGVNNGGAPLPDNAIKTAAELIQAMQGIISKGPDSIEQLTCYATAARYISQSPDNYQAPPFNISETEIQEIGQALQILEGQYPYFTASLTSRYEKQCAFYGEKNLYRAPEGKPEYSCLTQLRILNQDYHPNEEHTSALNRLPPEIMYFIGRYTLSPTLGESAHQQIIERAASKETLPKKGEATRPYFLASILAETKEEQDFVSQLQEKESKGVGK